MGKGGGELLFHIKGLRFDFWSGNRQNFFSKSSN